MAENKKYYWLKLQKDFFRSKRIKKLRGLAGGDTYTIIYLKMQLLSLDRGGFLEYTGLEDSFAKELALDIDEKAENVAVTLNYLLSNGLLETSDNTEYLLPYAADNIGANGESTERVRKFRESKKLLSNKEKDKELEIEKEIDSTVTVTLHETQMKRFDIFWEKYPRKEGKQAAIKSWLKISPDEELFQRILVSVEEHKGCQQWRSSRYIPHPATWLNQKRWEDELTAVAESSNPFLVEAMK